MGVAEVVGIASAVVVALCGVIAKLWYALAGERRCNAELTERLNREHKRDLRWQLGMPTSLDPGPQSPAPPRSSLLIREAPREPPRPQRKPRK